MVLFHMLRNRITEFARDERASLVAEAVLILPALVWWYVGSMVFFQGYQASCAGKLNCIRAGDSLIPFDSKDVLF